MRCKEILKIIEILRLWDLGMTQRQIAASVNCGKSTVGEVQRRCKELGIDCKAASEIAEKSADELHKLIYPSMSVQNIKADPDWQAIHNRLMTRRRLNLRYIWVEEYSNSDGDHMSYSQFCRRYSSWLSDSGKKVVMAMDRAPGYELCVDWAGDVLEKCVFDTGTGKLLDAHIFVATLGDSGYPYAEAFPDEKQESWITANTHALEWICGLPVVIKPDNCKTAVTKSNYYDPVLNPAYLDFSKHYNVAIVPARVRKPKDKSVTEGTIGYLETWLMEWLVGKRFESYGELNVAIRERLMELIKRPFQQRAGSREEVYRLVDLPMLKPLPKDRFEIAEYIKRSVPDNYHVECHDFYYSVPYKMYRQKVTLRVTNTMIDILDINNVRVALHQRRWTGRRYVTDEAHMPPRHRKQREMDRRDGDSYRMWAANIGKSTRAAIDMLLRSHHVEQVSYRSCMGILHMADKHGKEALEEACGHALENGNVRYMAIKKYIESPPTRELAKVLPLPRHENLRDPSEFC
ncbi:MAG: IS21 family transposase [Holophagales bacterium]|jgi:transposase|nr:IS21 family transposase [Holophagales bacterium]